MNAVIMQAYGSPSILNEAVVCLLTLAAQGFAADGTEEALIYSDSPERFTALAPWIRTRHIADTDIADWRGPLNFVHRFKIKMLHEVLATGRYEKILYLDTDILVRHSLNPVWQKISPEQTCMHLAEGALEGKGNRILKKLHRFAKKASLTLPGSETYRIPTTAMMYNAGVLGLHGTHQPLLDRVLTLSDALHAAYPKHVMEQLAFSLVLQYGTQVSTTESTFLHYWYHKAFGSAITPWLSVHGRKPIAGQLAALPELDFDAHYEANRPRRKRWWQWF